MTINQLINKLYEIKGEHSDGDRIPIVIEDADTNWYLLLPDDAIRITEYKGNKYLVIKSHYGMEI